MHIFIYEENVQAYALLAGDEAQEKIWCTSVFVAFV